MRKLDQQTLFDLFPGLMPDGAAPVPVAAKKRRESPTEQLRSEMAPCFGCERFLLVRPGLCYSCSRENGMQPNSLPRRPDKTEPEGSDPDREARIALYAERAKKKRPLFGDDSAPVPVVQRQRKQPDLFTEEEAA